MFTPSFPPPPKKKLKIENKLYVNILIYSLNGQTLALIQLGKSTNNLIRMPAKLCFRKKKHIFSLDSESP